MMVSGSKKEILKSKVDPCDKCGKDNGKFSAVHKIR